MDAQNSKIISPQGGNSEYHNEQNFYIFIYMNYFKKINLKSKRGCSDIFNRVTV